MAVRVGCVSLDIPRVSVCAYNTRPSYSCKMDCCPMCSGTTRPCAECGDACGLSIRCACCERVLCHGCVNTQVTTYRCLEYHHSESDIGKMYGPRCGKEVPLCMVQYCEKGHENDEWLRAPGVWYRFNSHSLQESRRSHRSPLEPQEEGPCDCNSCQNKFCFCKCTCPRTTLYRVEDKTHKDTQKCFNFGQG